MKVRLAYIEEPPFYWTADDGNAMGSDIELAEVVLRAIGATSIEHHRTTFGELLPGVQENRWDMNVPIFITQQRAELVTFSRPVWALGDGLLVRRQSPTQPASYSTVAREGARLGVVSDTIQIDAAKDAGVKQDNIVLFSNQPDALAALEAGDIDAYASTAVGSRAIASEKPELLALDLESSPDELVPVGGYSFNKKNRGLIEAVDQQLQLYLGSADHRTRMAKHGLASAEIDSVVAK